LGLFSPSPFALAVVGPVVVGPIVVEVDTFSRVDASLLLRWGLRVEVAFVTVVVAYL
jgi:hypothetical protein